MLYVHRTLFFGVLVSSILVGLVGCGTVAENRPPVIDRVDGNRDVHVGDSVDYTCVASDPESKPLDYSWTATRGSLRFTWSRMARWFPPDSAGYDTLCVVVTDGGDSVVTESVFVSVLHDTTTMVWWDGAVRAGAYREWSDSVEAGFKIAGRSTTVSDTSTQVYLSIYQENEFQEWLEGQPAQALFHRLAYESDSFAVPVTATDRYHVVIDNTASSSDYNYWLWVFSVSR